MSRQTLTLTFDPEKVRFAPQADRGLDYLLLRLVKGEPVADGALDVWGIAIGDGTGPIDQLRNITEDDVELALGEGCFVGLPLTTAAEVVEAVQCLVDRVAGTEE